MVGDKYTYTFIGEAASKKNGRRIAHVHGRPYILPSDNYERWEREARKTILCTGRPSKPMQAASMVVDIYHGDMVKRDTNNATQGVQDVLVAMGVIADDNWMVIGTPSVIHHIDVANPRVVVTLSEIEPIDYKSLFAAERKAVKK